MGPEQPALGGPGFGLLVGESMGPIFGIQNQELSDVRVGNYVEPAQKVIIH